MSARLIRSMRAQIIAPRLVGRMVNAAAAVRAPEGVSPRAWLHHLVEHLPIARAGEDPEGVHQVRVASARLLVWLELGRWRVLKDDLHWLRGRVSRMRDLDVLRAEDPSAFRAKRLDRDLVIARRELLQALDDPRVESLILALSSMPPVPIRKPRSVARRLAKVCLRRGVALRARGHSLDALHRLRCAIRRLRFAFEWTGHEVPRIVELQEAIGTVCDHAVALRQVERTSGGRSRGERRRRRLAQALHRSRRLALRSWKRTRPLLKELA